MHAWFTSRTHLIIIPGSWYSVCRSFSYLCCRSYVLCSSNVGRHFSLCCTIVNVNDSFWFSAPGEPTLPTEGKLHDQWCPLTRPKITHLRQLAETHSEKRYVYRGACEWDVLLCFGYCAGRTYARSHESVWGVSHSCELSCLDYTFSSSSV